MRFTLSLTLLTGCTATLVCEADVDGEVVETREVHDCRTYLTGINYVLDVERGCARDLGAVTCQCQWEGAEDCGDGQDD